MSAGLNAAEFVACMSPILFDNRYSPYQLASWTETGQYPSVNGNLLLLSSRFGSQTEEQFFIIRDGSSAYELSNADSVGICAFFNRIIAELPFRPTPLKVFEQTPMDYSSLVLSCLSRELNRTVFCYGTDISFAQVPTDVAVAAFRDKALFSPETADSLVKQIVPLHERRFQNLYTKKKPYIGTLSLEGCRRFLESGISRDQFAGIRPFFPKERLLIFSTMLKYAEENRSYSPSCSRMKHFWANILRCAMTASAWPSPNTTQIMTWTPDTTMCFCPIRPSPASIRITSKRSFSRSAAIRGMRA